VACLLGIIALFTPRFVLVVLQLFTDYLSRAYGSFFWPLLGFLFLPTTTIGYAIAQNSFHGVRGWGLVIIIIGVIADFGLLGGGAKARRREAY
jgi:uncharacterized membrane protein